MVQNKDEPNKGVQMKRKDLFKRFEEEAKGIDLSLKSTAKPTECLSVDEKGLGVLSTKLQRQWALLFGGGAASNPSEQEQLERYFWKSVRKDFPRALTIRRDWLVAGKIRRHIMVVLQLGF